MHTALRHATSTAPSAVVGRPRPSMSDRRACTSRPLAQLNQRAATRTNEKSWRAESLINSDEQDQRLASWMNAVQAGDRTPYENLLRASIPFIKMVVRRQGVATDCVDDVVQDTLLTIHRIRRTYDPTRSYLAWLRTIAQRRAIDFLRSQGRTSRREVYEPLAFENHSDPTNNPEDATDQVNRKSFVGVAVATLPAKQRLAVEQLALKGRSLADAAVATGLTPGALKVNLHRALRTLRAQIGVANVVDDRNLSELLPVIRDDLTPTAHEYANTKHAFVKSEM